VSGRILAAIVGLPRPHLLFIRIRRGYTRERVGWGGMEGVWPWIVGEERVERANRRLSPGAKVVNIEHRVPRCSSLLAPLPAAQVPSSGHPLPPCLPTPSARTPPYSLNTVVSPHAPTPPSAEVTAEKPSSRLEPHGTLESWEVDPLLAVGTGVGSG
jgi:hypothetical protein